MASASVAVTCKTAPVEMPCGRLALLVETWVGDHLLGVTVFDPYEEE